MTGEGAARPLPESGSSSDVGGALKIFFAKNAAISSWKSPSANQNQCNLSFKKKAAKENVKANAPQMDPAMIDALLFAFTYPITPPDVISTPLATPTSTAVSAAIDIGFKSE
eukprot:CAMPEP_0194516716 /NCGR_PEP_ID=MMETSP0253-20130528/49677_1 /TAXON_ID=2966 /ORGANISM="Noctiluca scintillans" /LENGTH=111 /DNA_ID=CAMNT_0039360611 /DNA_START=145 /DNA_END=477 /DNA_ORIENTATION=+